MRDSGWESRNRAFAAWVAALLAFASMLKAEPEYVAFSTNLPDGAKCVVDVHQLRPTQFAVGMKEVQMRVAKLRKKELSAALDRYLLKKIMPIVIGPGGVPFVLDHHHLARVLLEAGGRTTLYAEVRANWSHATQSEFWARMKEKNWLYLYDESGRGPLTPDQLPKTIAEMRDDPYRSLAWIVRDKGGYRDTDELFAEFQWANYFRTRIPVETVRNDFDMAVEDAMKLTSSREAEKLPGYVSSQ